MLGRHAEDFGDGRRAGLMARNPMQAQNLPHLLQHVPVVIDPGLIDAQTNRHPPFFKLHKRQNTTSKTEI